MVMRRTKKEDISEIVRIKLQMHREGGYFDLLRDDIDSFIEKTYQFLYSSQKAIHFVFKHDGKIISCAGGFIKSEMPYSFRKIPFYGYITDVYTIPTYRNNGYASALVQQVIDWLQSNGIKDIRLISTLQSRKIYEKIGFRATDEMVLSIE